QTENQRLDANGTKSHLAVGDHNASLDDVSGNHFHLQARVHHLDVHSAVGDLTALKIGFGQRAQDWQNDPGDVQVVNPPVAVAQISTGGAVQRAQHPLG